MNTKKFPVCTHSALCFEIGNMTTEKQLTAFLDMHTLTAKVVKTIRTGPSWGKPWGEPKRKTLHITGGDIDITVSVEAKLFNEKGT